MPPVPSADLRGDLDRLERFAANVDLLALVDPGGRGGSNFFLCLFDSHPEILACPYVHYAYSYWVRMFGDRARISADEAAHFIREYSYFRFLYNDPLGDVAAYIRKIGGDPADDFDRRRFRDLVDALLERRAEWTRRDLYALLFGAFALARGRQPEAYRYILLNDAISLNWEDMTQGFSGAVVDAMLHDHPRARMIGLVRDPRAQFASVRHQMVNQLDNNYGVTPANAPARLWELVRGRISASTGPANLNLIYQVTALKTLFRKVEEAPGNWIVVRNEDINIHFRPTMRSLCAWIGTSVDPVWLSDGYQAHMMGNPWQGTGAYSTRYQTVADGRLSNDTQEQVQQTTRPNRYVTERWRTLIGRRECAVLDYCFADVMRPLGYEAVTEGPIGFGRFLRNLLAFFAGEEPSIFWIAGGARKNLGLGARRLFYAVVFPVFYLISRWHLGRYAAAGLFRCPAPPRDLPLLRPSAAQEAPPTSDTASLMK